MNPIIRSGRVVIPELVRIFQKHRLYPIRLNNFGEHFANRECCGISAIIIDRIGYNLAFRKNRDVGHASAKEWAAVASKFWSERSTEIGLTEVYAISFSKGWDGRTRAAFADLLEQADADRGYEDGERAYAEVMAAVGTAPAQATDAANKVVLYAADQGVA